MFSLLKLYNKKNTANLCFVVCTRFQETVCYACLAQCPEIVYQIFMGSSVLPKVFIHCPHLRSKPKHVYLEKYMGENTE